MFTNSANTSFGGFSNPTQSSPFGQSTATAFGKPLGTTSFGTTATPNVFGTNNQASLFNPKPATATTGGLFGSTAAPAFGQPATTQSTFGNFNAQPANTSLFGTQQNANTSLFGGNNAAPAFGQTSKPAGFGFGTTTGSGLSWGAPAQQSVQQAAPFGQTNTTTTTNVFGAGNNSFLGNNKPSTGTAIAKFAPVLATDTMVKNNQTTTINTRHQCITCMKEYETKSFEELRLEDYQAGLKGPSQQPQQQQQQQTGGLFGAPTSTLGFGNTNTTNANTSGFGQMSTNFGNTNQPTTTSTLFGKPQFGAPTATTSSFTFNPTTSTSNLFANTQQNKGFGTTTGTSLFGNTNTTQQPQTTFGTVNNNNNNNNQPSTLFGTQQPQNQSIGLFGQQAKTGFNTAPNTGFSFNQTATPNANTSLFGAKPATAPGFNTGTAFGQQQAPSFGATTSFGTQQNTTQSLFNTSSTFAKPAQTGFSFNSTPASGATTLGTNTGLNGGLFGQNKPLFSGTTTQFGNTTTSGFGNNNNNSGFGNITNNSSTLGIGGLMNNSTFNNNNNNSQMQHNSSSAAVHQQILALVSAPFGDSPLLKNLLPASGKAEQILKPANPTKSMSNTHFKISTSNNNSPRIKARVVTPSQLSKKSLFDGLEEGDPSLLEAFQPKTNAKRLVLRPKSVSSSPAIIISGSSSGSGGGGGGNSSANNNANNDETFNFNKTIDDQNNSIQSNKNNEITINKENLQQDNRQPGGDRRSSTSWLKSQLPRIARLNDEDFDGQKSPFNTSDIPEDALENTVTEIRQHAINNQATKDGQLQSSSSSSPNININTSISGNKSADVSELFNDSSRDLDESLLPSLQNDFPINKANVILRRAGYYINPPIDKLDDYVNNDTCIVPNFTIGRQGYGNVYFPESIDIYGLNLDEIVHFRNKEVTIYPDDDKKPPVGQGLNRRAQVTLDCIWPHDKNTHEPIKDPQRLIAMNYEGKLRRVSAKYDTRFIDYRPETGSWVFKVDHFSKYGLGDSDDEDDDDNPPKNLAAKKLKLNKTVTIKNQTNDKNIKKDKTIVNKKKGLNNNEKMEMDSDAEKNWYNDNENDEDNNNDNEDDDDEDEDEDDNDNDSINMDTINNKNNNKQTPLSPTSIYARLTGTDSHKLQLMKASFFDTDDCNDENNDKLINNNNNNDNLKFKKKFNYHDDSIDNNNLLLLRKNLTSLNDSSMINELNTSYDKLNDNNKKKKFISNNSNNNNNSNNKSISIMNKFFPAPIIKPKTVVLKYKCEVIPLDKTIGNKLNFSTIADIGIQMGRKFKPSWGPGLTLVSLSSHEQSSTIPLVNKISQIDNYVCGRMIDDKTSTNIVQRIQILGGKSPSNDYIKLFNDSIEEHLKIQLKYCIIDNDNDDNNSCPLIRPANGDSGILSLHEHCNLSIDIANNNNADRLSIYASDVWQLCTALWGSLPDIDTDKNSECHHNVMVRRDAFSEWLKCVVENTHKQEIIKINNDDELLLSLLSANKLEEACELARKIGDYTLALLISQISGFSSVKELIKQTIALWQATDVINNISLCRLKIYMLVAGEHLINYNNNDIINVCENFDWKRSLAIHLWYLSSPTASITDVIELYDNSYNIETDDMIYAAPPLPDYKDEEFEPISIGKIKTYDLCYHLLKLYSTGNHSLEELLNPMTHTSDPLDYRLTWLLQQTIIGLGYSHLSDNVASMTHINFSSQLESANLWHWSIFVVLHLNNLIIRKKAVFDLLSRHVEIDDDDDYCKREKFLIEQLNIPSMWINEAKAIKSCAMKRYSEAAWYYLQAQHWNKAHEIIIEHIAADAIINENYYYLKSLLIPLVSIESDNVINGWLHQGKLLWQYMEIVTEVENFLKNTDYTNIGYKLELLQPQLTSLCTKINQFPCPTAKLRLCQAEIAKRTLHLTKSLLMLQSPEDMSTARILVHLTSQLPLPEDYAQQELRTILNMCIHEVSEN